VGKYFRLWLTTFRELDNRFPASKVQEQPGFGTLKVLNAKVNFKKSGYYASTYGGIS
jgi:hypothetical protein